MVTNVTSFSRSGLSDFVVQRVTAVVIAMYVLCLTGFFVANPAVDFDTLRSFFGSLPMRMFSTLAVLATAAHAWIGMWTVGTDYLRAHYFGRRATVVRIVYQFAVIGVLFIYTLWALQIFWRA